MAALLVFSAVGLVLFGGASMLLLRHYLLSRVDQQLLHFSVHRVFETPPRVPSDYRITVLRSDGVVVSEIGQQLGQAGGPRLPAWDRSRQQAQANAPFTVPDLAGGNAWQVREVQLPDSGRWPSPCRWRRWRRRCGSC